MVNGKIPSVLEAVDTVTTLLSGEKYSMLSLALPLMFGLRNSMQITENDPTVVSTIKRCLKEQLTGRFHLDDLELGSAPVIAAATDPRFRKLSFLTDDQQKKVRDILMERASGISSCNDCPSACEPPAKKKTALEQILGEEQEDEGGSVVAEVDTYLAEWPIKRSNDPLQWWKHNPERFPRLANVARRHLCISSTSTSSERVFSLAGIVVDKHRCALTAEMVDAIVFLHMNTTLLGLEEPHDSLPSKPVKPGSLILQQADESNDESDTDSAPALPELSNE